MPSVKTIVVTAAIAAIIIYAANRTAVGQKFLGPKAA